MKSSFVVCINLNANHNQISIQLLWKTSPKDYITMREPVNFSVVNVQSNGKFFGKSCQFYTIHKEYKCKYIS